MSPFRPYGIVLVTFASAKMSQIYDKMSRRVKVCPGVMTRLSKPIMFGRTNLVMVDDCRGCREVRTNGGTGAALQRRSFPCLKACEFRACKRSVI